MSKEHSISATAPPEGFTRYPANTGFTDVMQPFFIQHNSNEVKLGLRVDEQHLNAMSICHGGVLMMLSDIASAHNIRLKHHEKAGVPTINLNIDFITAAAKDDWLETKVDSLKIEQSMGYVSGRIHRVSADISASTDICRFKGTVYITSQSRFAIRKEALRKLYK